MGTTQYKIGTYEHCPQRGLTRAEAARQAITETAERERKRSGLAAEVAKLAVDRVDRAERRQVMADMDAIAAEWPERRGG